MSDDYDFSILRPGSSHPSTDRVQKQNPPPSSAQSAASNAPALRSCVTCRRRKVKCDKKIPCSNCQRARIECVFPSPIRAPRKPRKPAESELLERLKRLEGALQSLGAHVEDDVLSPIAPLSISKGDAESVKAEQKAKLDTEKSAAHSLGWSRGYNCDNIPSEMQPPDLETRFGRLVINDGKSRYINNSFWANLNSEVEDLKGILKYEPSDDEEDYYPSPDSPETTSSHQAFIFGFSSSNVDMLPLHPHRETVPRIWSLYKQNVDPLVKVLHIPTMEPIILEAKDHLDNLPKGLEALLFAIYYGAVTSLMPHECVAEFGETQQVLLTKYRFALEQALARANFLDCGEIIILQAFIIFLIALRRNDDARIIWTLTGVVVRMSQTLGIHRDGSHFGLSPFEIEMRRRLWWQVCILDARASEDHGCDPTIVEAQFDTWMPLNVNDDDLFPEMAELPVSRKGFTEMTFCLVRFEVANIFRRILYVPPGPEKCSSFFASLPIEQKEQWISECHQRLEETYLQDADLTVPLYWVAATLSRLVLSKMWLVVYHPYQRLDGGASLPQETKDKLFLTSLESVEYANLLDNDPRTQKWGWLFRTYVQWHSIALLLSELCIRTSGPLVQRAWSAIEATVRTRFGNTLTDSKRTVLWRPLRKLMAKARIARQREAAAEIQALGISPSTAEHMLESYPAIDALVTRGSTQWDGPSPSNQGQKQIGSGGNVYWAPSPQAHPNSSSPSAVGTPATTNSQGTPGNGHPSPQASTSTNVAASNTPATAPGVNRAAQEFASLYDAGFDWLISDVIAGNTPTVPGFANTTNSPSTTNPPNVGSNFATSSQNPPRDRTASGSIGDDMNWESWDNLVREVASGSPGVNNSIGMATWF